MPPSLRFVPGTTDHKAIQAPYGRPGASAAFHTLLSVVTAVPIFTFNGF